MKLYQFIALTVLFATTVKINAFLNDHQTPLTNLLADKKNQVIDLYMMPYEKTGALNRLIAEIDKAKKYIDVSIYTITKAEIGDALLRAIDRKVKIRIIYDHSTNKSIKSSIIWKFKGIDKITLCELGIKKGKKDRYIMHHKLIIIDNKIIGIGSANWSNNAFGGNYESLMFLNHNRVIEKASRYYEKMIEECDNLA